jgi:hypothetical protein
LSRKASRGEKVVKQHSSGHQYAAEPVSNEANRLVGWASLVLGAGSGLLIGLWSFDGPVPAPVSLENYSDLSRRFIRLGHIAFFGLGILNIMLAREASGLAVGAKVKRTALHAMNFGNIALPLTLFAAALYHPLKYLLPFSAVSVFVALSIAAYGVWRGREELR